VSRRILGRRGGPESSLARKGKGPHQPSRVPLRPFHPSAWLLPFISGGFFFCLIFRMVPLSLPACSIWFAGRVQLDSSNRAFFDEPACSAGPTRLPGLLHGGRPRCPPAAISPTPLPAPSTQPLLFFPFSSISPHADSLRGLNGADGPACRAVFNRNRQLDADFPASTTCNCTDFFLY